MQTLWREKRSLKSGSILKCVPDGFCEEVYERIVSVMDRSVLLKEAILSKYKSIRAFSIEMEIPYSTLATAMERGIDGMAYGTVIRICEKLNLNPIDFKPLDAPSDVSEQIVAGNVMKYYFKLNSQGREQALGIIRDYTEIPRYTV